MFRARRVLPRSWEPFLYTLKGAPAARQTVQPPSRIEARAAKSSGPNVTEAKKCHQAGGAAGSRRAGAAACRALRAEAHRARRRRLAAPYPQTGGGRCHAAPMTAPAKLTGASSAPGALSPSKITVKGALEGASHRADP
jgi:hypothetical protein